MKFEQKLNCPENKEKIRKSINFEKFLLKF